MNQSELNWTHVYQIDPQWSSMVPSDAFKYKITKVNKQERNHNITHVQKYTNIQVNKYTSTQVYYYSSTQVHKFTSKQEYKYISTNVKIKYTNTH